MSSRKASPPRSPRTPTGSSRAGKQRLQRVLAAAGFGSRRSCEELITSGRVEVDGEIVTELGTQVDPEKNKIFVDGTRLQRQRPVYYLLNKPVGVVTTTSDPQGRPRVVDLIPAAERVFPVGRLDRSSEGLILLTNDGELAQQLTHPRYGVRKVYHVTVAGQVTPETMKKMRHGIFIAEGRVRVEGARIRKAKSRATDMEITLREGKNREIRRILARFGHKVQRLRRIAIGPLRLGELPVGAHRPLTAAEVEKLRNEMAAARKRASSSPKDGGSGDGSNAPPAGLPRKPAASSRRGTASARPRKNTSSGITVKPPKSQRRRSAAADVEFDLDRTEPTTGAVIGAEPSEPKRGTPNKKPRRQAGTGPSSGRGKGKSRRGTSTGRSQGERTGRPGKRPSTAKGKSNKHGKPRKKGRGQ